MIQNAIYISSRVSGDHSFHPQSNRNFILQHCLSRGENFKAEISKLSKQLKHVQLTPKDKFKKVVAEMDKLFVICEQRTKHKVDTLIENSRLTHITPASLGLSGIYPGDYIVFCQKTEFDEGHFGKQFEYSPNTRDIFVKNDQIKDWAIYEEGMDTWATLMFVSDVLLKCGRRNEMPSGVMKQLTKAVESAQKKHLSELSVAYLSALRYKTPVQSDY